MFELTTAGIEIVIGALVPDYEDVRRRIAAAVINRNMRRSDRIAKALGVGEPVVKHVIQWWGEQRLALISHDNHGAEVLDVYPPLRRWFRGLRPPTVPARSTATPSSLVDSAGGRDVRGDAAPRPR